MASAVACPGMTIPDQLNRLVSMGMAVPDREQAAHSLRHIGYHRLSSYWQPFQVLSANGSGWVFRTGTEFSNVIQHYVFDGYLRSSLVEALGQIEISARALWASQLANEGGDRAHLNPSLFTPEKHQANLIELERNYNRAAERGSTDWNVATIWEATEAMSFGQLSKWYDSVSVRRTRNEIAIHYGLNQKVLSSVIRNLAHLRNICAHHGRLWNRNLYTGIRIPKTLAAYCSTRTKERLYNRLVVIAYLTSVIDPQSFWKSELVDLMVSYPTICQARMGFPVNWREMEFWQG